MYVILVYDVVEKRVSKVHKHFLRYLNWVQNSVFEGEITEATFFSMLQGVKEIINEKEDSLIIYKFDSKKYFERQNIGVKKREPEEFIF